MVGLFHGLCPMAQHCTMVARSGFLLWFELQRLRKGAVKSSSGVFASC